MYGPFSNILCTLHNKPITRIQTGKEINSAERLLCSLCKGQGDSIEQLQLTLDQLQQLFKDSHLNYKNFQSQLQSLKIELEKMINQLFLYIQNVIQQSEFEITKLIRYIKYQEFGQEFTLEDLRKIVELVYNSDIKNSVIYKTTQQLKEIQSNYRNQFIQLFEMLIKLIKGDSSNKQERPNMIPKPQNHIPKKLFEIKKEYETSMVQAAIFNQTGNLLFQGQYPFCNYKNLEILQIDENLEFKPQSIIDYNNNNVDVQVTALAINDKCNQLFVGYQNGLISLYENVGNGWNQKDQQYQHQDQVTTLIVDFSNTELFSGGKDNFIKSYTFKQGLKICNKMKSFRQELQEFQLNKESKYLLVLIENQLQIFNNNKELSDFQQIILENEEKITCLSQGNRQIYVGSNLGNIYIYQQQKIESEFKYIAFSKLMQNSLISIKYCEATKIFLTLFEDQVILYQINSSGKLDSLQQINGKFELSAIHNNQNYSKIILFSMSNNKAYIYKRTNQVQY
ncbi:unnamed protein product [Paramecium octaurelia]|uniref:WD40-repeat-containing domain n=1 Tax=Paramecium octaurelia TaxID=43137 RepID=A0A8S1TZ74_PAROT|nr:unnamed protein product [Paramecium octaurelia]